MGKSTRNNAISIRAPPHRELSCGFNGVRATKPRLFGTVEVRSPAGEPIAAVYVSLALYRHENISYRPEGRSSLTSQKYSSTTAVGKEVLLWQAPNGRSHEDIMSMDLPFMIPFPTKSEDLLPATLFHPSRSVTYELVATLHSTQFANESASLVPIMEKFDHLPIWGMFTQPQILKPMSLDHIVEMEVLLPKSCYGPGDKISCSITLTGNPDWDARVKKVRIEKLVMTLDQTVTYRLSDPSSTTTSSSSAAAAANAHGSSSSLPGTMHTRTKKVGESKIDVGGMKFSKPFTHNISLAFPSPPPDKSSSSSLIHASSSSCLFTTHCKLFTITFSITIKASFKNAKDIVCLVPITASQYPASKAAVILDNIESAVYEAQDVVLVSGLCGDPVVVRKSDVGFSGIGEKRKTLIIE